MMKKVRRRTITVFLVAAISGAALLHVSQNVQQAEDELTRHEHSYKGERESIRILNAEWVYLNSPARLEQLAQDYLDVAAPNADQMMPNMSVLPAASVPTRAPQGLYRNISQSPQGVPKIAGDEESVSAPAPSPGRKPKSAKGDFGALLNRAGKEGAR